MRPLPPLIDHSVKIRIRSRIREVEGPYVPVMNHRPTYTHVFQLILELRQAALENGEAALAREDGGWGLCLGSALANDAADALEAMLAERRPASETKEGTVVSIRFGTLPERESARPPQRSRLR